MIGNNTPTIKNKINAPMPAPGNITCETGIGVTVGVMLAVAAKVGVAVFVGVDVTDGVCVAVGVNVFVDVAVNINVIGTGVKVLVISFSASALVGVHGTPDASKQAPCANT